MRAPLRREETKPSAPETDATVEGPSDEPSPEPAPEQAQELPPIPDDESRKTDAAPPSQPVSAPVALTPAPVETAMPELPGKDSAPKKMSAKTNAGSNAGAEGRTQQHALDAMADGTQDTTEEQTPARDAKSLQADTPDTPPLSESRQTVQIKPVPPPAAPPAPLSPAPIQTPVVLTPDDRAVKSTQPRPPQESTSTSTEQHAETGEPAKTEESGKPPTPLSRTQFAPLPAPGAAPGSAAPQPTPAPAPAPATSPSAPPPTASSFLELQPQSGPRTGAWGSHAASTLSASTSHQAGEASRTDEFSPQMVRSAMAMTRSTGGAMTIRLEPESLGSLRIQMNMSQGRVAVQFHAETAQARGLLNQHIETLRTAMESHGLKLENVQIHTLARPGSSGSPGHEQQSPSQSGDDANSRHDAGGHQSRGHGDTAEREAQYRQAARQFRNSNQSGASWRQQWDNAAASAATQSPSLATP